MSKQKLIYTLELLPESDTSENSVCDLGLGKATKRGIKKCPNCGFINGTRCNMCKNPLCSRILITADKPIQEKIQIDAVKLLTGAVTRQIYSVRVCDEIPGEDQRGFVQLTRAHHAHSAFENDQSSKSFNEVALCFVNSCRQFFDDSILKCHENEGANGAFCIHIEGALKSLSVAHALDFKHDLINTLKVGDDFKKKLCSLAKSTEGPLVQSIARNVLAVKCFVNSTHPLGYLHFTLYFKPDSTGINEGIERFSCECTPSTRDKQEVKCLHYYACVCAFASDAKYVQKFPVFIQNEFEEFGVFEPLDFEPACDFNSLIEMDNIRIEILKPELLGLGVVAKQNNKKHKKQKAGGTRKMTKTKPRENKAKSNDKIKILVNELIKPKDSIVDVVDNIQPTSATSATCATSDVISFHEWFISVIERINLAAAYQSSFEVFDFCLDEDYDTVNQEQLTFNIPERFFVLFKDRVAMATSNIMQVCTYCIENEQQLLNLFTINVNDSASGSSQLFIKVDQLHIDKQRPFRIEWIPHVYRLSCFGELVFTFTKKNLQSGL